MLLGAETGDPETVSGAGDADGQRPDRSLNWSGLDAGLDENGALETEDRGRLDQSRPPSPTPTPEPSEDGEDSDEEALGSDEEDEDLVGDAPPPRKKGALAKKKVDISGPMRKSKDLQPPTPLALPKSINWKNAWKDVDRDALSEMIGSTDTRPSTANALLNPQQLARILLCDSLKDGYDPEKRFPEDVVRSTPSYLSLKYLESACYVVEMNERTRASFRVRSKDKDGLGSRRQTKKQVLKRKSDPSATQILLDDADDAEIAAAEAAAAAAAQLPKVKPYGHVLYWTVMADERGNLAKILSRFAVDQAKRAGKFPPEGFRFVGTMTVAIQIIEETSVVKAKVTVDVPGKVSRFAAVQCWWPPGTTRRDWAPAADDVGGSGGVGGGDDGGAFGGGTFGGRGFGAGGFGAGAGDRDAGGGQGGSGGGKRRWPPSDPGAGPSSAPMDDSASSVGSVARQASEALSEARTQQKAKVRRTPFAASTLNSLVEWLVVGKWRKIDDGIKAWRTMQQKNGRRLYLNDLVMARGTLKNAMTRYRNLHRLPTQDGRGGTAEPVLWDAERIAEAAGLMGGYVKTANIIGTQGPPCLFVFHPTLPAEIKLRLLTSSSSPAFLIADTTYEV